MSYILEALKKAESERQLGSAPGLHAAPVHAGTRALPVRQLALGAGAVALVAGAVSVAWLNWPAPRKAAAPAKVAVMAPAPAPLVEGPLFAPAPPQPARVAPKPPAPIAQPAPEERYPLLADVPESVARDLPRVTIGGYIYAKNSADSLLLVDRNLRREGEEVAPGLVLEKLLRKSAVMNYRGFRYRVPY